MELNLTMTFRDIEDLHLNQVDLIRTLQDCITSPNRTDAGYLTLNIIEAFSIKMYEVATELSSAVKPTPKANSTALKITHTAANGLNADQVKNVG